MSEPGARLEGLVVEDARGRRIVDNVSVGVAAGRTLAIVGESGSGKTTLVLALLGHVRPGLRLVHGRACVDGEDLLACPSARLRDVRRGRIAYVPQDPPTSLCPGLRIERLVADVVRPTADGDLRSDVRAALRRASLPTDDGFLRRYAHELSGGQQQRVAIAIALAARPRVLVLDEPTTGLDVVTQDAILAELDDLRSGGLTLVLVSHDLALVAQHADEIAVMHAGRIVEHGSRQSILGAPRHARTRALLALRMPARSLAPVVAATPMLEVEGLTATYRGPHGSVVAARDVSFALHAGECLALVGSSGCGKTTIARCVAGLHRPDAGTVKLGGDELAAVARHRPSAQRRRLAIVFQNPYDSLNPRRRVHAIIARQLRLHRVVAHSEIDGEVGRLMRQVELDPALAHQQPAQLSGGERQRVAIARALAARPEVLICDEVTSSLDASVQAAVLDLLARLRDELGLALLVISHDMALVARLATRIVVLQRGTVVEHGSARQLLHAPTSALGQALHAATRPPLNDEA